jgi:hypothetical protein
MTTMSLQRLILCIELSASDNDHKALAAIRKANGILKREGWTWSSLFAKRQSVYEHGVQQGMAQAYQQRMAMMGGGPVVYGFSV